LHDPIAADRYPTSLRAQRLEEMPDKRRSLEAAVAP